MSLSVTTTPYPFPVYSNNLIFNAIETTADSLYTYEFEVYINSVLYDTFRFPADPTTYDATIDLSPVLSTHFESQLYLPTGTTLIEAIPDSMPDYRVRVNCYDENNMLVTTLLDGYRWMFNGCTNINEPFTMADYVLQSGGTGKWLTNWDSNRVITIGDYAYLTTISGDYGTGMVSDFTGVTITSYQDEAVVSAITETYSSNTVKTLLNIDVSPSAINALHPGFISTDTDYYTVSNEYITTPMKVSLQKEYKLGKYYNFLYINRLGGTDFFTAVKSSDDEYKIEKKTLSQFVRQKQYYTDSERTTAVLTQFMTASQAEGFKELFSSPSVYMSIESTLNDVRITNRTVVVPDRQQSKARFIQYDIEFQYNSKNFVQQF